ncbi:CHCH domain containing protein, partial [Musa troglodytarum]
SFDRLRTEPGLTRPTRTSLTGTLAKSSSDAALSFIGRNISEDFRSPFCTPFLAAPVDFSHHQKRNRRTTRERTMEAATPQPVCAKEALDLLNCAVDTPFDRDRCLRFLDALRSCVLEKVIL